MIKKKIKKIKNNKLLIWSIQLALTILKKGFLLIISFRTMVKVMLNKNKPFNKHQHFQFYKETLNHLPFVIHRYVTKMEILMFIKCLVIYVVMLSVNPPILPLVLAVNNSMNSPLYQILT